MKTNPQSLSFKYPDEGKVFHTYIRMPASLSPGQVSGVETVVSRGVFARGDHDRRVWDEVEC